MNIKSPARLTASRAFLCLFVFFIPGKSIIFAATPLQTHDLNPITAIFGLPLISPARLPAADKSFFSASLNLTNTLNVEDQTNESIFIDGETNELNLIYLFSINDKTRIRFRVPFISHNAGSLDGFIDDFHSTFGFPEGERPDYPNDQLLFSYTKDGVELIHLEDANQGIGDINIDTAYQLYADSTRAGSVWASVKLPTGDSDLLTGSGNIDVSAWFSAEEVFAQDWSRYYTIGALVPGRSDILPEQQKDIVIFGTKGYEWQVANKVALNVQLDFHTAFYQSHILFLSGSLQLSMGGHIKLGDNQRIELVVIEDLLPGASPDVTFQFGYSQLY